MHGHLAQWHQNVFISLCNQPAHKHIIIFIITIIVDSSNINISVISSITIIIVIIFIIIRMTVIIGIMICINRNVIKFNLSFIVIISMCYDDSNNVYRFVVVLEVVTIIVVVVVKTQDNHIKYKLNCVANTDTRPKAHFKITMFAQRSKLYPYASYRTTLFLHAHICTSCMDMYTYICMYTFQTTLAVYVFFFFFSCVTASSNARHDKICMHMYIHMSKDANI